MIGPWSERGKGRTAADHNHCPHGVIEKRSDARTPEPPAVAQQAHGLRVRHAVHLQDGHGPEGELAGCVRSIGVGWGSGPHHWSVAATAPSRIHSTPGIPHATPRVKAPCPARPGTPMTHTHTHTHGTHPRNQHAHPRHTHPSNCSVNTETNAPALWVRNSSSVMRTSSKGTPPTCSARRMGSARPPKSK